MIKRRYQVAGPTQLISFSKGDAAVLSVIYTPDSTHAAVRQPSNRTFAVSDLGTPARPLAASCTDGSYLVVSDVSGPETVVERLVSGQLRPIATLPSVGVTSVACGGDGLVVSVSGSGIFEVRSGRPVTRVLGGLNGMLVGTGRSLWLLTNQNDGNLQVRAVDSQSLDAGAAGSISNPGSSLVLGAPDQLTRRLWIAASGRGGFKLVELATD
jgi:hypothetical protein